MTEIDALTAAAVTDASAHLALADAHEERGDITAALAHRVCGMFLLGGQKTLSTYIILDAVAPGFPRGVLRAARRNRKIRLTTPFPSHAVDRMTPSDAEILFVARRVIAWVQENLPAFRAARDRMARQSPRS